MINNKNSLLFEVKNLEDLKNKILKLYNNKKLREKLID
jgi:hypothetical protein